MPCRSSPPSWPCSCPGAVTVHSMPFAGPWPVDRPGRNWTWTRLGGDILSEPVYQFWQMLALVLAVRVGRRGGIAGSVALGLALGAATLTRYVGTPLAAAVALDLGLRGRFREAVVSTLFASLMLLPWWIWMLRAGQSTHLGLLPAGTSLLSTIAHQSLFYLQRIPDQIVGPFVEVGTIYRHSMPLHIAVHVWAVLATGLILYGWIVSLRRPRRRIVALGAWPPSPFCWSGPSPRPAGSSSPWSPPCWWGRSRASPPCWPASVSAVRPAAGRLRLYFLSLCPTRSTPSRLTGPGAPTRSTRPASGCEKRRINGDRADPSPRRTLLAIRPPGWTPDDVDLDDPASLARRQIFYLVLEPGPPDDPLRRFVELQPHRVRLKMSAGTRPGVRVYVGAW